MVTLEWSVWMMVNQLNCRSYCWRARVSACIADDSSVVTCVCVCVYIYNNSINLANETVIISHKKAMTTIMLKWELE